MTPNPISVGVMLCDSVIVEESTRKTTPVGIFNGLALARFPGVAPPFSAFLMLTDGQGTGTIRLAMSRMDTGEEVYVREGQVYFPDRLRVIDYRMRLRSCPFPAPGWYLFSVSVDGELVAHRRLHVYQEGTLS